MAHGTSVQSLLKTESEIFLVMEASSCMGSSRTGHSNSTFNPIPRDYIIGVGNSGMLMVFGLGDINLKRRYSSKRRQRTKGTRVIDVSIEGNASNNTLAYNWSYRSRKFPSNQTSSTVGIGWPLTSLRHHSRPQIPDHKTLRQLLLNSHVTPLQFQLYTLFTLTAAPLLIFPPPYPTYPPHQCRMVAHRAQTADPAIQIRDVPMQLP